MKKLILYTTLVLASVQAAEAQTKKSKNTSRNTPPGAAPTVNNPISLTNWGTYNVKNNEGRSLTIADPTINTLNRRANGEPVPFNAKEILGVPKITYRLGNGQLLFRSRGATTSGTGTGNGLVGTGSGLGPVGINGLSLGVNGKSPYAGPIMEGLITSGLPEAQPEPVRKNGKAKSQK